VANAQCQEIDIVRGELGELGALGKLGKLGKMSN